MSALVIGTSIFLACTRCGPSLEGLLFAYGVVIAIPSVVLLLVGSALGCSKSRIARGIASSLGGVGLSLTVGCDLLLLALSGGEQILLVCSYLLIASLLPIACS